MSSLIIDGSTKPQIFAKKKVFSRILKIKSD
jgi:hypothetical protein